MAGESPGREQQQESSGEAAEQKARDPRLTVFRGPDVVPDAVREEHGGLPDDPVPGTDPRPEDHPEPADAPRMSGGGADDDGHGSLPRQAGASASDGGTTTPDVVSGPDAAVIEPTDFVDAHDGPGDAAPDEEPVSPDVDEPEDSVANADGAADDDADDSGEGPDSAADASADASTDEPADAPGEAPEDAPEDVPAGASGNEPEKAAADEPEPEDAPEPEIAAADEPEDAPVDAPADPPADEPEDAPVDAPADPPADEPEDAPVDVPAPGKPEAEVVRSAPADVAADPRTESPAEPPRASEDQSASPHALAWPEVVRPARPAAPEPAAPVAPATPVPAPFGAPGGGQRDAGPQGTRQMPLPPAPGQPLKLLAELTNTPPPRQTAMRTVARRFKIWTPLVVLLLIAFAVAQSLRPLPDPVLKLTADSSFTFPGAAPSLTWPVMGQSAAEIEGLGSLGVKGAQTPVPIASVTKVMTAYVILRDHPLKGQESGGKIRIDQTAADEASSVNESKVHVQAGQEFTERQMLEMLLIPSGNNIARALARWDAGTQEAFVVKMQKAAADLGMTNTTYTGASGYEETTKSTAVDQLKLARVVMQNDVFRAVVATPDTVVPGVPKLYNTNVLLSSTPGVIGIKTGSSTPAAGALMWAAQKTIDGKPQLVLGVVLQQRKGSTPDEMMKYAMNTSKPLITDARNALTSAVVVKKGEVIGYVDDGLGGQAAVVATKDLKAIGWSGLKSDLKLVAGAAGLPHSAKAGTEVGTLSLGTGAGETKVPVALQSDLAEPSFGDKLIRLG
ncbi:D-alanyl-D-alanine carboxypeptidase [Streptomyces sp. H10-C2]|uniref:D-alanyl-D-alanine carboxypeptidase n=1 Tax=unclassified Streptomyces TaxID=2593676 RepID=UPI0024B9942D|nr:MULTISPECIES: D-alanyl-D-alanine carboxypeptidase [unclassified Streptomyces]MDJ0342303.1 D-alanyl-D-alanine carboxypeptidase [Streptomyces sp. PH10-H1]MDJ0372158.1 D-alanyl-D-alanine carboxypeptidase [Streptomyces sp. H10-C2]